MATLPKTPETIVERITDSLAGRVPTFVLEAFSGDSDGPGELVGLSSIIRDLSPQAYTIICRVQRDPTTRRATRLLRQERFVEASELCTLFLQPQHRGGGNGRLLSLGRFLHIAEDPTAFCDTLFVELRGVLDEEGVSPFWRAACNDVFGIDPNVAHARLKNDPAYILELLPDDALDLTPLPPGIRQLVGRVHQITEPARRLLEAEGFTDSEHIDLYDAGPIYICRRDDARILREAELHSFEQSTKPKADEAATHMISSHHDGFRCCVCAGPHPTAEVASALRLSVGDRYRAVPLRPAAGT